MAPRLLLALASLALGLLYPGRHTPTAPALPAVLVKFHSGLPAGERGALLRSIGAVVVGEIPQLGIYSLAVPAGRAPAAVTALDANPAVLFAEPDAQAWAAAEPDDPAWGLQWGPQRVGAPLAWDWTTGSRDLVIAIVDSGIDLDHPDLTNQLRANSGEVPHNGIDDDGNGKVDDVWGWHFYHDGILQMEDNQVADDNGHGTHVAGIAGAQTDNGVGIAGMAGGSRLMAVKVLDRFGFGWYSDIAQGMVYAADNGARILNLSVGGTAPSATLQAAVDYAWTRGALVVAATGNDGGAVLYPAACEHVIAVAAADPGDGRPAFSNRGPQVDVAAPGVEIYSTWPWRDGYWTKTGTSMATPHVAGLAALVWSLAPTWTPQQVTAVITRTAVDIEASGWDPESGWGRIDADAAVRSVVQPMPVLRKEINPGRHGPREPITYTLMVGNIGQAMAGAVLSDTLPAQVRLLSATPPAAYDPARHELTWGPLALATGERFTATVVTVAKTQVLPCTLVTNRAHLFHDSLSQPLAVTAEYRVFPCAIYLPLVPKAP